MENLRDHPDIASALRSGYPTWMRDDWEDDEEDEE